MTLVSQSNVKNYKPYERLTWFISDTSWFSIFKPIAQWDVVWGIDITQKEKIRNLFTKLAIYLCKSWKTNEKEGKIKRPKLKLKRKIRRHINICQSSQSVFHILFTSKLVGLSWRKLEHYQTHLKRCEAKVQLCQECWIKSKKQK